MSLLFFCITLALLPGTFSTDDIIIVRERGSKLLFPGQPIHLELDSLDGITSNW